MSNRDSLQHLAMPDWQRSGMPHVWMPYTQMKTAPPPIAVESTEGVHLILADGSRLIDGLASWWTACHGYNHPHIREAVAAQLGRMPHVMFGGIVHEGALELASRLAALLPGTLDHVFFCDSGSVAVEVAMKIAVQYGLNQGFTGRTKFVCFRHAYHGDTVGAMSLCDPVNSMHSLFQGFLLEQLPLDIPRDPAEAARFAKFLGDHRREIAGVVIEPLVQGAGGMKFHPPEALTVIRRVCDEENLLLIADEIATGFGRTGSMFACEQAGVVPDIICLGKALTGGTLGMAATVATQEVWEKFYTDDPQQALMHGPTFMANPLACAAANASLDLFELEPRLEQVQQIEKFMSSALQPCAELAGVVDVRCKGAVGVVQVRQLHSVQRMRDRFIEEGVWLRPFNDMVYLTPSFSITPEELETLCTATVRVMTEWSHW